MKIFNKSGKSREEDLKDYKSRICSNLDAGLVFITK
jgi:hypothetical protein